MLIRYTRTVTEPDCIAGQAPELDADGVEIQPGQIRDLPPHLAEQLVGEGYAVAEPDPLPVFVPARAPKRGDPDF